MPSQRFDGSQLLRQRIDQRRHSSRRHNAIGMAIESDNERNSLVLARIGYRLTNNLLMPQMHAVEKSYRQANLALACVQFLRSMDNIHRETVTPGLANQYGAKSP